MDAVYQKFPFLKRFELVQLPTLADVGNRAKAIANKVPFSDDIVALYFCAIDKSVPSKVKISIVAALAYLVLPVDLIPDILVGLGFTDDVAVLTAVYSLVSSHITDAHRKDAKQFFDSNTDDSTSEGC
jgi:uncharacterized membrane protein YkvA (DUF1232 family)